LLSPILQSEALADKYYYGELHREGPIIPGAAGSSRDLPSDPKLFNLRAATASNEEFLRIQRTAHEKNKTSEQASFALEKHIREHGC
jgi:hypothetical protein